MEILTNTSCERLATIAENFINHIFEDRGSGSIEDLVSAFVNAGFTKSEFIQVLDNFLLEQYEWEEETAVNRSKETEVNSEEVSVGDNDQAILETALTQIGINYDYYGDHTDNNFIELKDNNNYSLGVEIYFDANGNYTEILH